MSPSLLGILAAAAVATVAAAAGVLWLARKAKVRYRELLGAVQTVQRQASELRSGLDETRAIAMRVEDRLAARVEPELTRLGRHLELEDAAAEVRRAAAGRLAPEVAARLGDHLAALDREIAGGERPY
jgi:hypothetical protein